jgi:hypothetical protein
MTRSIRSWLRAVAARSGVATVGRRKLAAPQPPFQPHLDTLEDRTLLSTYTVSNLADSGPGSLRQAVLDANAQGGANQITFALDLHGSIALTSGELEVDNDLTITGPGADTIALSGNNSSRVFEIAGGSHVSISALAFMQGRASAGGSIFEETGAALTLSHCAFSANEAVGDANGNALGGAVFASAGATLQVTSCSFQNNQTDGTNQSFGGALYNLGTATVTGSSFSANQAMGSTASVNQPVGAGNLGGAIMDEDGSTLVVSHSTFTSNQALGAAGGDAEGGAIDNESAYLVPFTGVGVTAQVTQCSFVDNQAVGGLEAAHGGFGGAIEDNPGVTLTVTGSTFQNNVADSGPGTTSGSGATGGAIDDSPLDTVSIAGCSFVDNAAIGSSTGATAGGGAIDNFYYMTITQSVFIGNRAQGGPGADGVETFGEGLGGAIYNDSGAKSFGGNLTLNGCTLIGNLAVGGSGGFTLANPRATASAVGGAIINQPGSPMEVSGCLVTGNRAVGGDGGSSPGAIGFGGGIVTSGSTAVIRNCTVEGNVAEGGTGDAGYAGGVGAGGGIVNTNSGSATVSDSLIAFNTAIGGQGGAGGAGGEGLAGGMANGLRGFVFGANDTSSLTVSGCTLVGNVVLGGTGGTGANGGDGLGGGLLVGAGSAMLLDTRIVNNDALGGNAGTGGSVGEGIGGGVYVADAATAGADAQTVIRGNHASTSHDDVFGVITDI